MKTATESPGEAAGSGKPYTYHLILNTHWDREYRWSFRETQLRLMEAGDILLDSMEKDPRFRYFHPDAQASFLDDYLELRPERRPRVERLVREGRLMAGPWYTLPSEFVVSGESLVRNLLTGHRLAAELGGVMKVAYNIFSWGQVSQLPQIYRQFGMDTVLFYRGIDQSKLDRFEFWWEAPDGSRVLGHTFGAYHRLNFWIFVYNPYLKGIPSQGSIPSGGYDLDRIREHGGVMVRLADEHSSGDINHHILRQPCMRNLDLAVEGMEVLRDSLTAGASTSQLLCFQGFDQENPDPEITNLVDALNARLTDGQIKISSLSDYLEAMRSELKENGTEDQLLTMKGEMLSVESSDDAFAPLYIGTFSARMPLKLQNAACQYALERWAEPAQSWWSLLGKDYPVEPLRLAWRELLQNQQHDGIGGCHVDRIQQTMEERNRTAMDLAESLTRDALNGLTAEVDLSGLDARELGVTVFNPSVFPRREVLTVTVDIPHDWNLRLRGDYRYPILLEMTDTEGAPVTLQQLSVEDETLYAYLQYGNAINFPATRIRICFEAEVPGMGYRVYRVRPQPKALRPVQRLSPLPGVLENAHLRAEIRADGSIDLLDKATGTCFPGLHVFENSGEMGGPLLHTPPNTNRIFHTRGQPARISMLCDGPVQTTWRVDWDWMLPEGLDEDRKIHVPFGAEFVEYGACKRSERMACLKIRSEITLRRDSRRLEFVTTVDNTLRDHRLRVCFPSGLAGADSVQVDSPFDVVSRSIAIPDSTGWYEAAARTLPTSSFVDLCDGGRGLAVLHQGLSEYEVVDHAERTLALTLLRCFHTAGNPTETFAPQELAQCQGRHTFRYALYPHGGDWREGGVHREALCFTSPFRATVSMAHAGTLPLKHSFLELDSHDFVVSALKQAEDGDGLILRGVNPTRDSLDLRLRLPAAVEAVEKVTLEECALETCSIEEGVCAFTARPGEIVSLRLRSRKA